MMELPEAVLSANQFNEHLADKTVINAEAAHAPHKFAWYYGDPSEYGRYLSGKKIGPARQVGGMVEMTVGDMLILLSEGPGIRLYADMKGVPSKHQLLLQFAEGGGLVVTVQMYAGIWCFRPGSFDNPYYFIAKKKPSPLTAAFNENYFMGMINADEVQKLSVKAFLATGQRIPGLGNGVLQEILFDACIHPKRKIESLNEAIRLDLFSTVRSTLKEITLQGGRDTEKDIFGCPGGFRTRASKNSVGKPCPRCGYPIVKAAYMGGSIYFCETCQPGK